MSLYSSCFRVSHIELAKNVVSGIKVHGALDRHWTKPLKHLWRAVRSPRWPEAKDHRHVKLVQWPRAECLPKAETLKTCGNDEGSLSTGEEAECRKNREKGRAGKREECFFPITSCKQSAFLTSLWLPAQCSLYAINAHQSVVELIEKRASRKGVRRQWR